MIMKSSYPYMLAGGLFVLMVGAIAWVTQFMPNWRSADPNAPTPVGKAQAAALRFVFLRAVWDKDDEEYALEMEKGRNGHFDYPFENLLDQAAEIGLVETSCGCSHLEVCLLPRAEWERYRQEILNNPLSARFGDWQWEKMTIDNKGLVVPPKGVGLVRVNWNTRGDLDSRLQLRPRIWHQPLSQLAGRNFETLQVSARVAAPIRFVPIRGSVGNLGSRDSGVAEFTLWSGTRPELDLKWDESAEPLYTYAAKPLSREQCKEMEKKLRAAGDNARVLKAFRFQVTVKEQASGKQLDQGPIYHTVNFLLDDEKVPGPLVVGNVRGDVLVGSAEERGKVDLKTFRAKEGAHRTVSLWTEDDQVILETESHAPRTLEIKLTKGEKIGSRTKWQLEVTVPPSTQFGAFSEESVIILRT